MNEERKVKYGFLHCHTDESNRDSVMTVETLVKRAAELGAPAVALTDHGVMTGYLRFAEECAKYDINAIFGVEAYVQEDAKPGEGTEEKRMHLILMAKDYEYGFKALIKAVSESNERMDSQGFARMNKDILRKYFGPGAPGHGHVIATSACVSGVLASLYSMNDEIAKKVEKLKTSQSGLETPTSPGYLHNRTRLDWIEKTLQESAKRITAYKKQSGKPTADLEKKIYAAAEGSAKRAAAQAAYDEVVEAKKEAAKKLALETSKKEALTGEKSRLAPVVKRLTTLYAGKQNGIVKRLDQTIFMWNCSTTDSRQKQKSCRDWQRFLTSLASRPFWRMMLIFRHPPEMMSWHDPLSVPPDF